MDAWLAGNRQPYSFLNGARFLLKSLRQAPRDVVRPLPSFD
jgi:hypothetical protein